MHSQVQDLVLCLFVTTLHFKILTLPEKGLHRGPGTAKYNNNNIEKEYINEYQGTNPQEEPKRPAYPKRVRN